jgi:hypothetical protein
MTVDESHAVLGELTSLATSQGWTQVTGYVAQLNAADRQVLIACAPNVRPEPLAAWLQSRNTASTVHIAELDALARDSGPALAADRVVIALRCGDLLVPATIAGAATVMGRPGGSYAIVLTEAERIQSESDLEAVLRAAGGALLGQEGAARRAGRGLLIWSEDAVPGFLAARVGDDATSLARWLAVIPEQSGQLTAQRAAYALELAAEAEAVDRSAATAQPARQAGVPPRQLSALRSTAVGLHARLLDHLDAQATSLTRELKASLDTVRHDLLREIGSPDRGQDPRAVESLVARRMSRWSDEAARLIAARQARWRQDAAELLGIIDWALVNEVVSRPDGRHYPDPIVESFTPGQPAVPPQRSGFTLPSSGPAPGPAWAPALRTATIGGVVTAAALAVLGVAVAPAVGAAAVGVAAATVIGSRRGPMAARRRTEAAAIDAGVRDELSRLMSVLTDELDAGTAKLRAATGAEFTRLESSLAAAEERAGQLQADPASRDPAATERIALLRTRLGLGGASQADRAVLPSDLA